MRIKVIVLNSVLHDARVLKEADTLAAAGHQVDIYGLFDKRANATEHVLPSKVRVHLVRPVLEEAVEHVLYYLKWGASAIFLIMLLLAGIWGLTSKRWLNVTLDLMVAPPWLTALVAAMVAFIVAHLLSKLITKVSKQTRYATLHRLARYTARYISLEQKLGRMIVRAVGKLSSKGQKLVRAAVRPAARRIYGRIRTAHILARASAEPGDVVHCHDLQALPIGAALKRKLGLRLIWDAHEIYEEVAQGDAKHAKMCRATLRKYQKEVDRFITINESIADFYAENYPKLPPATIVKNATHYNPGVRDDGRLHAAAGLPRMQKIALYQGGFAEKRGLRALVRSAAFLNPEWTLVMMGWGKLEDELKALARQIEERTNRSVPAVTFLPAAKQSELVYWTAGATVGLIPYENVGLNHLYCTPNKLWEYPAAGVPILCSPLVEMIKMVRQYGIGWFLPANAEPESIAKVINELSEEEIRICRRNCQAYIAEENWDRYGARVKALYDELQQKRI